MFMMSGYTIPSNDEEVIVGYANLAPRPAEKQCR